MIFAIIHSNKYFLTKENIYTKNKKNIINLSIIKKNSKTSDKHYRENTNEKKILLRLIIFLLN